MRIGKRKEDMPFSFRTLNKTSDLVQINHLVIRNIDEFFPRSVVLSHQSPEPSHFIPVQTLFTQQKESKDLSQDLKYIVI